MSKPAAGPVARLRAIYDPRAYCYALSRALAQQPCAHDFTQTRAIFARYAPDIPSEQVAAFITALEELGGYCDCEAQMNVCTRRDVLR